jgi:hypothetical protein
MLTSRPFDEVVERSQTQSLDVTPVGDGGRDEAVIRGYARKKLSNIFSLLRSWLSYMNVLLRVNSYELLTRLKARTILY